MNPIWSLANNYKLRSFLSDWSNLSYNIYDQDVPITPLEMAIDFFMYDFEIAEPPRVTSLKNVEPNPPFEEFKPATPNTRLTFHQLSC
ncbi:hypothetical protein SUGI_0592890 [Cryptomeria japonica]|nr:hypothetical protein SUGI_0592890 [Cryptomeria japonica]